MIFVSDTPVPLESLIFLKYLFIIYLAGPGLPWDMWDLRFSLWHSQSLVEAGKLLVAACGI